MSKVLQKADMYELGAAGLTIAAGCTVEGITSAKALQNLERGFPLILREFPALRLRFETAVDDDGATHWAFSHPSELAFAALVGPAESPDTAPPTALPIKEGPLWRLRISTSATTSNAHFRLFTSHSFCDGRTIFDLLSLFVHFATHADASLALPSVPEPFRSEWERRTRLGTLETDVLEGTPYGKRGWFTPETTAGMRGTPPSWWRTKPCRLTPTVAVPSYSVATQWSFPYEPVNAFCKGKGVTVQGIVGAVHARAMRVFNGVNVSEMCVCTPTDTRRYPFTTEEHRRSAFFGHNGFVLVYVQQKESLLDEIVLCSDELRKVMMTKETAHTVMFQTGCGADSWKEDEIGPFPDCGSRNVVCASHIGYVCRNMNVCEITFMMNNPVGENGAYWPSLYALHTDKVLTFSLLHPYNAPSEFVEAVHSTIKEAMNLCLEK